MARIYSRKKGRHGSKKPPIKVVPKWVKHSGADIEEIVVSLANQKMNSSEIGATLRDQYGIPDSSLITKKKVTQIMRENKLYEDIPEDLMSLFRKAVMLHDHMKNNKKDKKAVKGLENLESKIRRLVKYYSKERKLPTGFAYDPEKVKLIVQK